MPEVQDPCRHCGGGKTQCFRCYGSGREDCPTCNGRRTTTNYRGEQENCYTCYGSGKSTCTACSGSGQTNCTVCSGRGYTTRYEADPVQPSVPAGKWYPPSAPLPPSRPLPKGTPDDFVDTFGSYDSPTTQGDANTPQTAGSGEPFKPGFFSYAALALVGGAVLLFLGIVALSSDLYADAVMPFAAKQFVDARVQSVGGFATTDEWKKSPGYKPSPQFERWQYLTRSKARYVRFHPAILNANEPWKEMSTWLKRECSNGVEAACIDRAVGIRSGILRHDNDPIFPTSGRFAGSARLADIAARINDGLGFWAVSWLEAYQLGANYQINRPRKPADQPAL